jgi:hypothetical protein
MSDQNCSVLQLRMFWVDPHAGSAAEIEKPKEAAEAQD